MSGIDNGLSNRPASHECVARSSAAFVLLVWMFVALFAAVGYINFGPALFTIDHWLESHGLTSPWIGIPALIVTIAWLLHRTADQLRGWPCYVGSDGENLLRNGRPVIRLDEIESCEVTKYGVVIVRGIGGTKQVRLSSALCKLSGDELAARISVLAGCHSPPD